MLDISIHDCKGLRAIFDRGEHACWITLRFVDGRGHSDEIMVFFENASFARGLAEAINNTTMLEVA